MRLLSAVGRGIGAFLGSLVRAVRRHSQPCQTCRAFVIHHENELEAWYEKFQEALAQHRAQYARLCQREQKLAESFIGVPGMEAPAETQGGGRPTPNGDAADLELHELRQLARERGFRV